MDTCVNWDAAQHPHPYTSPALRAPLCATCNGDGYIDYASPDGDPEHAYMEGCPTCYGHGWTEPGDDDPREDPHYDY